MVAVKGKYVINASLRLGTLATKLKHTWVTSLLKKPSPHHSHVVNYQISLLQISFQVLSYLKVHFK